MRAVEIERGTDATGRVRVWRCKGTVLDNAESVLVVRAPRVVCLTDRGCEVVEGPVSLGAYLVLDGDLTHAGQALHANCGETEQGLGMMARVTRD